MLDRGLQTKSEKKQLILMLVLFLGFIPMLLFLYWGLNPLSIYFNANSYKEGFFYIEELDCGTGNGSDDFNCYAYGKINNKRTKVNIGTTPSVRTLSPDTNYANLSSDSIRVFYQPNLKHTIVRSNNEEKLDKNKYLIKGLINLIYPLIIYPYLIFLYRKEKSK